jgi:hypothetical protein
MDNEKQIEEMARDIEHCCNHYDEQDRFVGNKCSGCEYWCDTNNLCCSFGNKEATYLYEQGYRKLSKDSAVLTKTEKEKLLKEMYEQGKFDAIADLEKEGKFILTIATWVETKQFQYNLGFRTGKQIGCKETAEKIFSQIIWYAIKRIGQTSNDSYYQISFERLNELAKQFGVEIKE